MAKIKKPAKAQTGKDVPKGYVRGEMTGKLISKKKADDWNKSVTESMNEQYFSRPENLKYGKSKTKPAPKKKMKEGGSLGMKSVKAGYDKNPGVTRADIIVAAKGKAKYGKKVVNKSKKK